MFDGALSNLFIKLKTCLSLFYSAQCLFCFGRLYSSPLHCFLIWGGYHFSFDCSSDSLFPSDAFV